MAMTVQERTRTLLAGVDATLTEWGFKPVCSPTLGFAAAFDKKPGDYVSVGGEARRIENVRYEGADWPMYKLAGVSGLVSMDASGYVSWRFCGDAV